MLRGCVCCYVRKKALLQSLKLLRGGISASMRFSLFVFLLCFEMGTMLTNFHMCGIMLLLRSVLNRLESVLGARCLVYQDLVSCYFCFVYCILDLSCGECNVI